MTIQKIRLENDTKEIEFADYKDFIHQVEQYCKHPFVLINPDSPWEEIKHIKQFSDVVTVIPLSSSTSDKSTSYYDTSRSTLDHFLRTHEAKNQYFMNNPQYREKLNMEVHHFIHTEKDVMLFEKLVTKLEKLLSQQSFMSANNNYYLEWILNLTSLGSELPSPLATRIKKLSQHIVDSILYNTNT
jgi:hypothetical protein